MTHKKTMNRNNERGSALIYILIAIALLAALTVSFMQPSSQQGQSQGSFKTISELQSQVEFIRTSVQECILSHPGGDINIENGVGEEDEGADRRYPIKPNSLYYTSASFAPAADRSVEFIRCPGNPGDDVEHASIFGGRTGKFLPPAPDLFDNNTVSGMNGWQWYNGDDGVFYWIATEKSDAFIATALDKLDDEFADCEADVIDNSGGGTAEDMDSDTPDQAECPANSRCFRLWMISEPSAVYPDGC